MFGEIDVMAGRDLVWVWLRYCVSLFLLHHCFLVILLILSYHSIMGSYLGFGLEKVAQILGMLAQN